MRPGQAKHRGVGILAGALALVLGASGGASGHCDTMDGPVVKDAEAALEKGDVKAVLKWVPKEREREIREAFGKTLVVRAKGPEAKELADMYFFETLVRVHRAGEGEPYTGIKPVGAPISAPVMEADESLRNGDVDALAKRVAAAVEEGVRERFARAAEARQHKEESVEAGRRFVAAYVDFVHYVERIHGMATGHGGHDSQGGHDGHAAAMEGEREVEASPTKSTSHHEH